jgi:hypothetical protein
MARVGRFASTQAGGTDDRLGDTWVPTAILNRADPRPQAGQTEVSDWLLPSHAPVEVEPAAPEPAMATFSVDDTAAESSEGRVALRRRLDAQLGGARTRAMAAVEAVRSSRFPVRDDASTLVELNSVSFDGLRQMGLTATQADRVVAHREARGGFTSLDELSDVAGIPAARLAVLLKRVYLA